MNALAQQTEFLSWKIVPARLDALQAAWFLGFEPHEIPILTAAGLLKPLGHPARNATNAATVFFSLPSLYGHEIPGVNAATSLAAVRKRLAVIKDAFRPGVQRYWAHLKKGNITYAKEY